MPDSVREQRIAAAVGFGFLSGLVMAMAIGDADGDVKLQRRVILGSAALGAIGGYITGGRSTPD